MSDDEYTIGLYDDIIDLPHHVSETHPRMPMRDRAAQFSPFAALTGYGEVIRETGRITQPKIELGEDETEELNRKLKILSGSADRRPEVTVTYFRPDQMKEGGEYLTVSGKVRKIDGFKRAILMENGPEIPVEDILELDISS